MTSPSRQAAIHVIGNVNVDLIMGPVVPWPRPGTESMLPKSELRAGGAAGNTALALQAMGVNFRLICNIGDDIFGRWLAEAFGEAGRGWPTTPMLTTVSVGLTHPTGERTFLTSEGHLAAMTLDNALRLLPARAGKGDIALLCGVFLSPRLLESYDTLVGLLVERGFAVAIDTGWPPGGWTEITRRRVAAWLPACDHVLLNEIETCGLANESEVEAAAAWVAGRAKPKATVVVKRGRLGASAWRNETDAHVAAPKVAVIDTIGAGDVFNAGYLRACLQGCDLRAAIAAGVEIASAVISTSPRRYHPLPGDGRPLGGGK